MSTQRSSSMIKSGRDEDKIRSLREQRKESIRVHNFERAKEIDEEILQIKKDAADRLQRETREDFKRHLANILTKFQEKALVVKDECDQEVKMCRTRYHKIFLDMQSLQKNELADLEIEFANSRSRENLRKIPQYEQILEHSRKAATAGQYEEALSLREDARIFAQDDLQRRLAQVEDDFMQQRQGLLDKFRVAIVALQQRLKVDLERLESNRIARFEEEDKSKTAQIAVLVQKVQGKLVSGGALPDAQTAAHALEQDKKAVLQDFGMADDVASKSSKASRASKTSATSTPNKSRIPVRSP